MKRLVVASNNEHKIEEIKNILSKFDLEVLSLKEVGINIDIEETGTTFMENAYIKASEIYKIVEDAMVLADDSGLMVNALGGAPGVYSARFAGEHGNYKKNNEKLLEMLKGIKYEDRKGKFVCAMVLILGEDRTIKVQGEVNGFIVENQAGENGFGYDSLFYIPEYNMTFAQMDGEIKNKISHRARALRELEDNVRIAMQGE
ncbi:XTP/dITP diphosphatase [Clostridium sp. KNHs214]|uniref:XTP/dITP diphosphatase n=1 Tax=Clostridium sp. KNHs214 TaxID=1540257 RepID=UPI00055843B2|nr:XTP/dITP diphosphatase [Clostridium sp. KNHs214]